MNKIEKIIKVAIDGNWLSEISYNIEVANCNFSGGVRYGYCELAIKQDGVGQNTSYQKVSVGTIFLDPKFFQAIGKARGWDIHSDVTDALVYSLSATTGKIPKPNWLKYAIRFHEINLSDPIKGWDDAIDYLYNLIK